MDAKDFVKATGCEFFAGVPDSQLRALCDYLYEEKTLGKDHIIAANEGNAAGIAAGYYLATLKVPMVYMQNSGIGNIVNPSASLLNDHVYGIPVIFTVGWRGEPGVHDEPQHIYQGMVTVQLLEDMDIKTYIVSADTEAAQIEKIVKDSEARFKAGKSIAFIIRKGALTTENKAKYKNDNLLVREDVIETISKAAGDDIIVSTTGKASRELFEIREKRGEDHSHDFLTVGSMGHTSSIAYGIALQKPDSRVWCIDGDGSAIMHMGAIGVIGQGKPSNLIHVVINNGAHETVGGMPTAAGGISMISIAKDCGYENCYFADDEKSLGEALANAKSAVGPVMLEVKTSIYSRSDLGRPTTTAKENAEAFINFLKTK